MVLVPHRRGGPDLNRQGGKGPRHGGRRHPRLPRALRRFRNDVAAAFPVFEAILVAVLVFTAMVFVTSIQRPTTGKDAVGVDLARLAGDQLEILRTRTYEDPADSDVDLVLEQWVARVLEGDTAVAEDVDADIRGVLKGGLRYTLRLDNGIDTTHLLPPGEPPEPRAGRAAQMFFFPNWTEFEAKPTDIPAVAPGGKLDYSTWTDLRSPLGSNDAPDGDTWLAWWDEHEPVYDPADPPTREFVPRSALYGIWEYDVADPGTCPCYVHVGLPSAPGVVESNHAVYGLQLVVWFGA